HRQTLGSKNVCLLAILILDQRDKAASVRVVFDAFDLGGHIVLHPLEVNHAIHLLIAATAVLGGNDTVMIAAVSARLMRQQRLLRLEFGQLLGILQHASSSAAGGGRVVIFNRHGCLSCCS